jgi:subtilisin family serine protease
MIKKRSIFAASLLSLCVSSIVYAQANPEPKPMVRGLLKEIEQKSYKDGTLITTDKQELQQQLSDPDWQHADDKVGSGVDRALQKFGPGTSKVIVAVIDSGVDTSHPDLKGRIWTNKYERPGDGIDNDGNGYIDDVHGWSFVGVNQENTNLEMTRLYRAKALKYRNNYKLLTAEEARIKDTYEDESFGMEDHPYYDVTLSPLMTPDPFNPYKAVRDFPKLDDPYYGNNDPIGLGSDHGTHVAGIIAAKRDNDKKGEKPGLVTQGIAPMAKIMPIRVLADGDERDEDVANAVRYAVDNGAQVINMSFGKGFSPLQEDVAAAFKYAADHNVLMVHAAGNDASDVGEVPNFPSRFKMHPKVKKNWLEVGASTKYFGKDDFIAYFSNYGGQHGKATVDLFAPGAAIVSTVFDGSVNSLSGTSMASPHVAGIAALILSHNNELKGSEVKQLIMDNVNDYSTKLVMAPDGTYTTMGELSVSGGTINAFNALKAIYK